MAVQSNPKIAIPLTPSDKIVEIVGLVILAAFWYFTLFHYNQLPEIIPTHFTNNGEVDGYGGKWTIIFSPVIATILYLGITLASRFPHKLNYAVEITPENAKKQYTIFTGLLRILKIAVLLIFFMLDYQTIQLALGLPSLFGKSFMLIVFTLLFAPIFYFLIQSSKNS